MKYFGRNQLNDISLDDEDHLKNDYPEGFNKVNIKPGKSGAWKIEIFEVTKKEVSLYNLRLIRDGRLDRVVPPGWYTRLTRNGGVIMSDTPAEAHENFDGYCMANGHVLINGLGLGFVLQAILTKKEVTKVTVIEQSKDVIKLVSRSIKDQRVSIINADALTWAPPANETYGLVWHDIWDSICEDNKPQMKLLRKKYARKAARQGCWSEEYL